MYYYYSNLDGTIRMDVLKSLVNGACTGILILLLNLILNSAVSADEQTLEAAIVANAVGLLFAIFFGALSGAAQYLFDIEKKQETFDRFRMARDVFVSGIAGLAGYLVVPPEFTWQTSLLTIIACGWIGGRVMLIFSKLIEARVLPQSMGAKLGMSDADIAKAVDAYKKGPTDRTDARNT